MSRANHYTIELACDYNLSPQCNRRRFFQRGSIAAAEDAASEAGWRQVDGASSHVCGECAAQLWEQRKAAEVTA